LGRVPPDEVLALRRKALATFVSSRYDNFPTTVTEAMVAGCPLVATRVGGIPDMVDDGVSGLLCRPEDADDLAEKLLRLLHDPDLASRMGREAARSGEARFHPDLLASRMVEVYRRTIAEHAKGSRP
jgi:glycosyltransferase involved in cell wall biosynthesis